MPKLAGDGNQILSSCVATGCLINSSMRWGAWDMVEMQYPYLFILPLLSLAGGARGDRATQGPAARLAVEVGCADVGRGDGGGGGSEGNEGPGPWGGRLVAVLRGDGGVRPDGCCWQAGG